MIRGTVALSLLALLSGCGSATGPSAPKEASLGMPFGLRVDGSALIASEGLEVTFEAVAGDSRCPIGATCIWEGDGVVRVRLERRAQDRASLELHTNGGAGPDERDYQTYRVRLENLAPYPRVSQPIATKDYVATLVVFRG